MSSGRHGGAHGSHHGPDRPGWTLQEALAHLEDPERRRWHDPDRFWADAGLGPGETVVDLGSGSGFFAIPAARRVGPGGRIYAVDVTPELVEHLKVRRTQEGLAQLTPVLSTPNAIPLPDRIADRVLFANVLHDVPDPTVREAVRLLRPRGKLLNLDWRKDVESPGPPAEIRLRPAEARRRLEAAGLVFDSEETVGPFHYLLRMHAPA